MKIQVSKAFAKFINETASEKGVKLSASVVEVSPSAYGFYIADPYLNGYDYNSKKDVYKALYIEYPTEYYARPRYVTTRELNAEFTRLGVTGVDGLKNMIVDMFAI